MLRMHTTLTQLGYNLTFSMQDAIMNIAWKNPEHPVPLYRIVMVFFFWGDLTISVDNCKKPLIL